jgi:2,3-bisphosphoglycerate-dependent phosphoglycerate mutase
VKKLIFVRHGESVWNSENLFTGWVDVPLSEKGVEEAKRAGELIKDAKLYPEIVHTSLLRRAITTANYALDEADRLWIPVKRSWRLNERHYGDLQGKDKSAIREEYGDEQFMVWRRSYDIPPPEIHTDSKFYQGDDPRYWDVKPQVMTEALKNVLDRSLPYLHGAIFPGLKTGRTTLVVAHGNSIRAMIKYIDKISDDDITKVNIPTGIPLLYELNDELEVVSKGYLDPEAAKKSIQKVANQGK